MNNVKLKVAYDGTHYLGWQKTEMGPSIEAELERVISQILQQKIILQAASRTDAGVHARGQIVNFFTDKQICLDTFKISVNSLLSKDIAILEAEYATLSFHPTLDCIGKEYRYSLCYGAVQLPHRRFFSWHRPCPIDVAAMRHAASFFIGKHDFSALCNDKKNSNYKDYIRNVACIDIVEKSDYRLEIQVKGNNFLYKMVRNIVGTLVYVGCGKINLNKIQDILAGGKRTQAGVTAPALGLCLHQVDY